MKKIFQLGLFKTGTSSVAEALRYLGYSDAQGIATFDRGLTDQDYIAAMDEERDEEHVARRGLPWLAFPAYLLDRYPEAKFILTIRDPESWLKSVRAAWGRDLIAIHDWFFECEGIVENQYLFHFCEHHRNCLNFFADKPDRLLVMNVVAGDGWNKLAPFLGASIPAMPFPHRNKTRYA